MKKNNLVKLVMDCIKYARGNDETRKHLMGFYHCPENRALITVNGHLLGYSRRLYDPELEGKIINPDTYTTLPGTFPRINSVFDPDNLKNLDHYQVGLMSHHAVGGKKGSPIPCYFCYGDDQNEFKLFPTMEKPIDEGKIAFAVNSNFLKPLIQHKTMVNGYEIFFKKGDEPSLSMVAFNLSDYDEYYIVMPMKV